METLQRTITLSFFVCAFFANTLVVAGKPFEGIITYKISYPENKFSESQMAMFPKTMIVYIKGNKSRSEMPMSGASTTEIKDHIEKNSVTLLNAMGQKYSIRETLADIEATIAKYGKVSVENTSETRQIAGINCKKAIIQVDDKGVKSTAEAFFTTELGLANPNFDVPLYKDIDGILLEYTLISGEITMKYTAGSIEKKGLSAKDFEIPADFKPVSREELNSMFGGGNE